MQSRFIDFIRKNHLASENDNILLGVSGGIDSMVMLSLFHKSGFNFAVAHCNFSLRGEESDGDEELVVYECLEKEHKLHKTRFDTQKYAIENKLSIQVAARNLRYDWFKNLAKDYGYTKIAIAHNRDDVTETVLINLTRGTGIKGLCGIKAVHGNIIRPLLFASRDEIVRYAALNDVKYRNDSSNSTVKYARNRIRHNVIPELEVINPSAKASIALSAQHIQEGWNLVESYLLKLREILVKDEVDVKYISIEGLKKEPYHKLFLLEELNSYGFTPETIEQVADSINRQPGKVFFSHSHKIVRDREFLILSKITNQDETLINISADTQLVEYPLRITFSQIENSTTFQIPKDPRIAAIDLDKIQFPVTIRHWQPGDKFVPIGMNGYKKVSDFLIDQKYSLNDKEKVLVMESGNDIIWIVGVRIDDRYKITDQTKRIWVANC